MNQSIDNPCPCCGCSPCVLGNLWDVTTADIDYISLELIRQWLCGEGGARPTLASLLPKARLNCTMKALNGYAPVLYGLPLPLNTPSEEICVANRPLFVPAVVASPNR